MTDNEGTAVERLPNPGELCKCDGGSGHLAVRVIRTSHGDLPTCTMAGEEAQVVARRLARALAGDDFGDAGGR